MTYHDFAQKYNTTAYKVAKEKSAFQTLRLGQYLINNLYKENPDLHDKIINTEADCYYIETRVPIFWATIKKLWQQ